MQIKNWIKDKERKRKSKQGNNDNSEEIKTRRGKKKEIERTKETGEERREKDTQGKLI